MRTLFFTLVPLLLFFFCFEAQASTCGTLSGRVTDDAGNPLVGATVLIEGTTRGGYTKSDGSFTILKINAGSYSVRVKSLGFKDHTQSVSIVPDQIMHIDITLAPDSRRTEGIVVAAERLANPNQIGSVRSISTPTNIPVNSVQPVIARQPGVVASSNMNIRGGRTAQTVYRINGLDVSDQFAGGTGSTPQNYYPSKDNTNTANTKYILGGPSAEYGNAISGTTRQDQTDVATLTRAAIKMTETDNDKFSTFGMDVDNASYTIARTFLREKIMPPQNSIRPEEFLNYFDYGYAAPCEDEFAVYMECAPSMFASNGTHLLKIGIKARELYNDERSAAVLTFVIDISGSMADDLPMIKNTLTGLVKKLRTDDLVSIVTFGSTAEVHLKPTSVEQRNAILNSINELRITGSTNVGAGIKLGYDMAAAGFDAQKINRVVFLGDGVANNGLTKGDAILQTISESAKQGIALTMIGMGMGTYNDALMEELANRGDGKYFYIDSNRELDAILNNNFVGLLDDVARDAKIQVEFDPLVVQSYRLIGYKDRAIADSLFRDDTQDAGEVGAGHTVTALYEVKLRPNSEGMLARIAIRYAVGRSTAVREIQEEISTEQIRSSYNDAGYSFRLATVAAKFAEFLGGTSSTGESVDQLASYANDIAELSGGLPEVVELRDIITNAVSAGSAASVAGKP